ncbi:RHS repeat-associated core domain-containing protein, partial [Tahibacter harae]
GTPNPVAVASTFHYDGLGSTRLLTDAAGSPVDRYAYHAFGERDEWTSELAAGQNPATDYQYTGEQFDPNLGLYYLRARYVDPGNGRFTQHDTFAGFSGDPVTLHKYAYANNNPSMLVDPSGYFSLVEASTVNNIIGHLSEFNVSSGFDLGNKLANPGSDLPSFEGWSMLASMIPFGTGARWLTRGLKEVKYGAGVVRYSAKHPPSEKEIAAAALIAEKNGAKIFLRGDGVKGADALIDGIKWEIKTLRAGTNNAVAGNIKWSVKRQSSRVVIDGRVAGLTEDAARAGIARAARDGYSATELMVLLPGDKILCF